MIEKIENILRVDIGDSFWDYKAIANDVLVAISQEIETWGDALPEPDNVYSAGFEECKRKILALLKEV